jgi:hypothetical protein
VWAHLQERVKHFLGAFTILRALRFSTFGITFIIVYFFSEDGKFSLFNKLIIGFNLIGWNSLVLMFQYVWNAWINKWWARGNLLIILD